jgi:hypothetical protein
MLLSSQPTHTLNALAVAATLVALLTIGLGVLVLLLLALKITPFHAANVVRRTMAERISVRLRTEFRHVPAHAQPVDTMEDHRPG